MGFKTREIDFFVIFHIIVHAKNTFPKFRVNRSEILGERDF